MNLPSIPSDNIYKFSTVLGVILIVFSLNTWFSRIEENSERLNNISHQNISEIIEQSYIEDEIEGLKEKLDTFYSIKIIKNKNIYYSSSPNLYSPKTFEMNDSIYLYKLN